MPALVLDRRTLRLIAIAFAILAILSVHRLFIADVPGTSNVLVVRGETMGTTYEIRIAGDALDDALREQVEVETDRRLAQIDDWMSNWNPDSEVSSFNAHHSTTEFPVSKELAEVVSYAIRLGEWSGGAFDIAVGPLVALWGFGFHPRIDSAPSEEEIARLRARLGPEMLRVQVKDSRSSITKNDPEAQIDVSAIAKGYGVDHVARGLESLGRRDYLVEIGGEIRCAGERPDGGPWRVAIEKPEIEGRGVHSIVELHDQAMATSGDYRIFYVEDGLHISHTIDPRTGRPVEGGPASVTVLADTATEADAWATTLMVLGESDGLALAEERNIAALILIRNEDGSVVARRNALFPDAPTIEKE